MSDIVTRVENISKLYRLGEVGTGSLAHDVNRWWHKVRGKEDPYLKIGEVNDRTKTVSSVQRPESSAKNANALDPRRSSLDSSAPALDSRPSTLVSPKAPPSDWVYALKDVSFEVKRGEVLGIIGRNGAGTQAAGQPRGRLPQAARRVRRRGKARINSTLLKILSRITTQSSGQIKVRGRIASLLEVGTGFHPELTEPSEVSFALHGPRRETEGWSAWSKSNRRLARRVQRWRGGANQNIFLNGAILGMRKAEIARKFDEIVEFSGCARYIDTPVTQAAGQPLGRLP